MCVRHGAPITSYGADYEGYGAVCGDAYSIQRNAGNYPEGARALFFSPSFFFVANINSYLQRRKEVPFFPHRVYL